MTSQGNHDNNWLLFIHRIIIGGFCYIKIEV